ncbi:hypothetical protein QAD02_016729 [Eretmocerus hayati]|uniref:Uncharacterized protein n=1 Tax=Eretmocerus hayati TaxID=131215 RepID=A0ACC2PBX9_9HYME|nr:hypothetical protein QAD02_016729 [Eretmocerus hayati]
MINKTTRLSQFRFFKTSFFFSGASRSAAATPRSPPPPLLPLLLLVFLGLSTSSWLPTAKANSPCPWSAQALSDLESSCTCDQNLARELSVQCESVDFPQLVTVLRRFAAASARIDLLYINNSTIGSLRNNTFSGVRIANLQLSGCALRSIEPEALSGQESSLRSLILRDNELQEVPSIALAHLRNLTVLDLSRNKISRVPERAFAPHRLVTLKLAGNYELALEPGSFKGLENSLKNLNLLGTKQRKLPEALKGLSALAFLDMSFNSIRELEDNNGFQGLSSLTGLNLEKNLIQSIAPDAFAGVSSKLSSLSLLNNLIPEFPTGAISTLQELKVLDIGFNLMTELPPRAFESNPSITLLAIDGNPMSTVSEEAFAGLNGTLRGLSLGGRFLVCDCKLRWIIDWIRTRDLQVTSREVKPQFCGTPQHLQARNFYTIQPEELSCERQTEIVGIGTVESVEPTGAILDQIDPKPGTYAPPPASSSGRPIHISTSAPIETSTAPSVSSSFGTHLPTTVQGPNSSAAPPPAQIQPNKRPYSQAPSNNVYATRASANPRPPLVTAKAKQGANFLGSGSPGAADSDIKITDVLWHDDRLVIRFDSDGPALGFRVVYRLFGNNTFENGARLDALDREVRIKNVPSQECIIVCVVGIEVSRPTPSNIPWNQCREVRIGSAFSNMDRITIAASATICLTIIAVALILLLASRRRRRTSSRKMHTLHHEPSKLPIAGLPVNCCSSLVGPTPSPNGPMNGNQPALSAYSVQKEWDQLSAYSTRSIPRPRIFPVERQGSVTRASCLDDGGGGGHGGPASLGPGTHMRGHYFPGASLGSSFAGLASRADLRHSRQSLAAASERLGGRPGFGSTVQMAPQAASNGRRQRPRSRNRDPGLPRPGSRYSLAESTHTLNNYEESNWTDHDMDIYMARNPTTRGGLVPL